MRLLDQPWNWWLVHNQFVRWHNVGSQVAICGLGPMLYPRHQAVSGPMLDQREIRQCWATGQNNVGPTSDSTVGPTDVQKFSSHVPTLDHRTKRHLVNHYFQRCWSTRGVLSGLVLLYNRRRYHQVEAYRSPFSITCIMS